MKDLYCHIRSQEILLKAWRKIRQSAYVSLSKYTKEEIQAFEIELLRNIKSIQGKLYRKTYKFNPSKGILFERKGKIPRPIVIADVKDRIVQRSILEVINNINDLNDIINHPTSFGGLTKKGVKQAVGMACYAINNGADYFIKSDIKDFFRKIPREIALDKLKDLLPDDSIFDLLDKATIVEIDNLSKLNKRYRDLFPSPDTGVAQGYCLSPLLGNVLLLEFDQIMNDNGCICLRYIDDFLVLGPNNKAVFKQFKKGIKLLNNLGMDVYRPGKNEKKAIEGSTKKSLDFLGCRISRNTVHPDRESRGRIKQKIREILENSKSNFFKIKNESEFDPDYSFINTLKRVNDTLMAWGNHYSFCNAKQIYKKLDLDIDRLLGNYIQTYDHEKNKLDQELRRKLFGVHLLNESNLKPIYPLQKKASYIEAIEESVEGYDLTTGTAKKG